MTNQMDMCPLLAVCTWAELYCCQCSHQKYIQNLQDLGPAGNQNLEFGTESVRSCWLMLYQLKFLRARCNTMKKQTKASIMKNNSIGARKEIIIRGTIKMIKMRINKRTKSTQIKL